MSVMEGTVAVTGLNATDNPAPGVSVIRAIRAHPDFRGRIVGLAYDSLDPGIYARELADDVFLIPYPSQGVEALAARLEYIDEEVGLDVIVPTLDSELPSFIALQESLQKRGIGMFLPTPQQLELRSKAHLLELGKQAGIAVPASKVISSVADLYKVHEEVPFPLYVKGLFYGADLARSVDEAVMAFHRVVARWGLPVIVQHALVGQEYDVVAVGDGRGGLVGAVPMKKTLLTDKGKGWAGIAVKDPALIQATRAFMAASRWRGPCEVEILKDEDGTYNLLEINPRFPAWVYLSAGAGMNLPYAVVQLARGEAVEPLTHFEVGTMFVRISLDQIARLEDFDRLTQSGELRGGVS
ncbi:MAG: ATP-grasp domain-containing protein [Myxococcales bacterium]|nr:ATP-grasp domain-containing protein [Myxococcales bacterium]MCB9649053.1 ATP-grasp domain-containing protein [Deltaproteobacteria bacterium]